METTEDSGDERKSKMKSTAAFTPTSPTAGWNIATGTNMGNRNGKNTNN